MRVNSHRRTVRLSPSCLSPLIIQRKEVGALLTLELAEGSRPFNIIS
jgi:hypothetical protein